MNDNSQIFLVRPSARQTVRGFVQLLVILASIVISVLNCSASAYNIYVAQTAAGSGNGADCADAYAYTFFNTAGNWGTGASQIGPGTTVHLCGTFTASAGTSGFLTFQASGTSGNPVILKFESGALIQAPWWSSNGAITTNGTLSYITVDGGTNGVIQATLNGSSSATCLGGPCQYQQNGFAINLFCGTNCEVKNLTVSDLYIHNSVSDNGGNNGIGVQGSNVTVDNNTVHDTTWAIVYSISTGTQTNFLAYDNTAYNVDHGIAVGNSGSASTLTGIIIYGNVLHDFANWDTTADTWHHDGIHIYVTTPGGVDNGDIAVYNNYVYGNYGNNDNAGIYLESGDGGGTIGTHYVFNNVLTASGGGCASAFITDYSNTGGNLFNNTIGSGACVIFSNRYVSTGSAVLENNVISSTSNPTGSYDPDGGTTVSTSNYNDWYGLSATETMNYGIFYAPFSSYVSATGLDQNSILTNPELTSFHPAIGSPVIGFGVNFYSTCHGQPNPGLGALCYDKAGVARPSSGNWTMGAYTSSSVAGPTAPTNLTASVQ